MTERPTRFNFTKRRADRAEQARTEQQRKDEHSAQLRREAKQLAEAIPQHFSTGALSVSQDGDVVTKIKKGPADRLRSGWLKLANTNWVLTEVPTWR
jgi:hypothetical protein